MTYPVERFERLVALSGSPEIEEARTAAYAACKMLRDGTIKLNLRPKPKPASSPSPARSEPARSSPPKNPFEGIDPFADFFRQQASADWTYPAWQDAIAKNAAAQAEDLRKRAEASRRREEAEFSIKIPRQWGKCKHCKSGFLDGDPRVHFRNGSLAHELCPDVPQKFWGEVCLFCREPLFTLDSPEILPGKFYAHPACVRRNFHPMVFGELARNVTKCAACGSSLAYDEAVASVIGPVHRACDVGFKDGGPRPALGVCFSCGGCFLPFDRIVSTVGGPRHERCPSSADQYSREQSFVFSDRPSQPCGGPLGLEASGSCGAPVFSGTAFIESRGVRFHVDCWNNIYPGKKRKT